ncbi:short-subunit dehydrogenase [Pontibacter ummariensis]|uniref:Short-chain dehydrogenase n=1 Tax=Pontibacter ummariensis TaxID=1610492 RepID=A0A239IC13_9BACT|nr:SDR family oxidoreductase [Pontibacter ummariensis]PRY09939.1 short-subunit dehydrogenase [Pontibacter ummariensis]SNS91059.1 Short-chain dehydrogenase [Pontibacter ummariensis]
MDTKDNTSGSRKGVAVITGASAGLGRAVAREFAKQGYDVALLARGIDGLEGGKKEVEALGRKGMYVQVDVADADAVERAAAQIEAELGEIDVWVNNAMNSVFSPVKEMKAEEYKRVTEVTYLGQVYGALSALKRMLPRDRGSIVFVGSALAYRGIPLQSAYCGSKHAIQGFYDSLRTELIHDKSNVKVTMVQLPAMNTTQFGFVKSRLPNKPRPMGKIYQPEVAAETIVYAAQHERREYRVGYPTLKAIVGNKIAPWYADLVLAKNGFKGQQTNEPEDPNRDNNLWDPIPGDHGAHGSFDKEATYSSPQVWLSLHRDEVAAGALAVGGILLGSLLTKKLMDQDDD